jgi:chromosomal replication initiator protein
MYLTRKMTTLSFPDIGEKVGGRDHSTVIYATNKIRQNMESDPSLKNMIEEIEDILKHKN